jgi:PAS domain S-box-containing protein
MTEAISVLLVEDNFDQALMVQDFLRLDGKYLVDWSRDIQQTWDAVKSKVYDLILMDYRLPDGNGIDFLKEYCKDENHYPVIMVTGEGDEQIAVQSIQLGALDYVVKRGTFYLSLPAVIEKTLREYNLKLSVKDSLEKIRYQALLLNNVRDAIIVWNLDGNINFVNHSAQMILGAKLSIGENIRHVYAKHFQPKLCFEEIPTIVNKEIERQVRSDRINIFVSSKITPLFDGDQLVGYMDVLRDISELKKKEYELLKLTSAIENSDESVIITSNEGIIEYANKAFERITNKKIEDVLGQFIFHIRGQSQEVLKKIVATLLNGESVQYEAWYQFDEGTSGYRLEEIVSPIFDENNALKNIIFTGRDITQKNLMQEEINLAKEKLSESTRLAAIGELSSGVAHRIYNPLTSIIANTQMLIKTKVSDDEMIEVLGDIEKAGWTAQNVVQQLLMFSKPNVGSFEQINVNETIENSILLVGGQIIAERMSIESKLDPSIPMIWGNRRQIEDLWVNLLLLSKDSKKDDNEDTIIIRSEAKADCIIVEIIDHGKPIPEQHEKNIFEPDFVGHESIRGSGLELSICREIVRQHSGDISVMSDVFETKFRIELPTE